MSYPPLPGSTTTPPSVFFRLCPTPTESYQPLPTKLDCFATIVAFGVLSATSCYDSQEPEKDIGGWRNVSLTRGAIYKRLFLPSLRELAEQNEGGKVVRFVALKGWGASYSVVCVWSPDGKPKFVLIDSETPNLADTVIRFKADLSQGDVKGAVETLSKLGGDHEGGKNRSDELGDDEDAVLIEQYGAKHNFFVLKAVTTFAGEDEAVCEQMNAFVEKHRPKLE